MVCCVVSGVLDGQVDFPDCGAIYDMVEFHKYAGSFEEASALALKAGCDLTCGSEYQFLTIAVNRGLITEKELDVALGRNLKARFLLGLFDPPGIVPYANIPATENDTPGHAALALRVACESIVLLKNDGLLPLNREKLKRIAVIGANANSVPMLLGNYCGKPSHPVTILDGIRRMVATNTEIIFEPGCPLSAYDGDTNMDASTEARVRAVTAAKTADVIIYVGGLSPELEGEDLHVSLDGFEGGDRTRIELPPAQLELLKALQATGKPVVFVNCSGAAVAMPWAATNIPAILQAWYPGQAGGTAVAGVLFGEVNPAGRLPVTFYRATEDLPAFTNYAMSNRTYRYFAGEPLFAFGACAPGLSEYAWFGEYQGTQLNRAEAWLGDVVQLSLDVSNIGAMDGEEVVQVYFRHVKSALPQAREALCGFRRVTVKQGQTARVTIEFPIKEFRYWDVATKQYVVEPGEYEIMAGAASDDIRAILPLRIRAKD